jgi:GxxExxY protein
MGSTSRADIELLHGELTGQLIGAFFEVYNELGHGFAEQVYQRAIVIALAERGVRMEVERAITIRYRGVIVGEYRADLIVDDKVIVECKVGPKILPAHETQLLNYLTATRFRIGLILNFGPEAAFRRMLMSSGGGPTAIVRA